MNNTTFPSTAYRLWNMFAQSLVNQASFREYLMPIGQLFSHRLHPQLIPCRIIRTQWENNKIYTITLKPDAAKFKPFKAGQFISLETEIDGQRLQRYFSISSSPSTFKTQGTIEVSIARQEKGRVTQWLAGHLTESQTLFVSQAQGEFVMAPNTPKALFIAAGSGITPILSMLKQAASQHLMNHTLLYFVADPQDLPFKASLDELKLSGLDIRILNRQRDGDLSSSLLDQLLLLEL